MKKTLAPMLFVLSIILVALLLSAGCNNSKAEKNGSTSKPDTPKLPPTTTTEISATSTNAADKEKTEITLYFVKDFHYVLNSESLFYLEPVKRSIPKTQSIAKAAVEEVLKGLEGRDIAAKGQQNIKFENTKREEWISFLPKNAKVLSVKIENGVATVDFDRKILTANVGSEGEELGIYQIVNTLTEFPTIEAVCFTVEGKSSGTIGGRGIEDWWGHIGLSRQPFKRNTALIHGGKVEASNIHIKTPRAFSIISSPLKISGTVQVFEATFKVRVIDKSNVVLVDEQVMASDFNWGKFNKNITFKAPKAAGKGTVLFYYNSPKDGSEVSLGTVPVIIK